jgi:hypothetical protein
MYRLSITLLLLSLSHLLVAQSPHGQSLQLDCAACHTASSWDIPAEFWAQGKAAKPSETETGTSKFNHNSTSFPLTGQHTVTDCRSCHETLVFSQANPECYACHTDMHQQTVGMDCARCHSTNHWLVDDVNEIHQINGFPLLGAHALANCIDCHASETNLRFDRLGNECFDCHQSDFQAATSPNHVQSGYSTNCIECHDIAAFSWGGATGINHFFFPLEKGHEIADCAACHTNGSFENTPSDCFACHQADFENAQTPNHSNLNFSTNCTDCHTTDIGWMPAKFLDHDALHFPIYSGEHNGEWNACTDCHTNPSNYAEFTCTSCHTNPETNNDHNGISGYSYNSPACLVCHPNGSADDGFDHNQTDFPLTGAHQTTDCIQCHSNGYAGTPTECSACHIDNYNQTNSPNHQAAGISTDCASCHTTNAWIPANFQDHDAMHFPIYSGQHNGEWDACTDCHTNPSNFQEFTCTSCHTNPETNNDHNGISGYSYNSPACLACHPTGDADDAFDHNQTNFPLTGAHQTTDCLECHSNGYAGTPTECSACHMNNYNQTSNPNHQAIGISSDCAQCHTTSAWMPAGFPIHNNYYMLQGAHGAIANDCDACHNGDYNNTPNTCFACHEADYNATNSPNHQSSQFPTDCAICHNESAWDPSTFDHDNMYFPIYSGKHKNEWDQCIECHTIAGNFEVFSCIDCHEHDNPSELAQDHQGVGNYQYSSPACYACHPDGSD